MKKVIIIGTGGHAAELRDYINLHNIARPADSLEVIGFIDDDRQGYDHYQFSEPFLGGIKDHKIREDAVYLMGIADLNFRKQFVEQFKKEGAIFIGLIHPTALISPSAEIGEGVVISHNASLGPKVKIGDFNMLNSRCTIGHDTVIGNYNFISPQVALSGYTKVGDGNLIGTNACTIPHISIGSHNKIAAGMIVYKPVGDNETVLFRHKERLSIRDKE